MRTVSFRSVWMWHDRWDCTPHCHLHLLCSSMLLEVSFLGTRFFLPLGGRLLTCQRPTGYQSAQGECEEHNATQSDTTRLNTTQRNTVQQNPAWNNRTTFKTRLHKPAKIANMKQHIITWKSTKEISVKHIRAESEQTCSHYWKWWKQRLVSNAVHLLFPHKVTFSGSEFKSKHTSVWHLR